MPLTPKEARALAGWCGWFTTQMAARNWPTVVWEDYEAHMHPNLWAAMAGGVFAGDPLDFGSETPRWAGATDHRR